MNYLAHIFLSGGNEEIIVGNFIGDYVKGYEFNEYSPMIRKGIILHRHIDSFTDKNMIVKLSKSRITDKYHKYSGIIIDIFYDHFLIALWDRYSLMPLNDYVIHVHAILRRFYEILPDGVKLILPSFIKNNWIQKYSTIDGVREILDRMSERTTLPDETDYAVEILHKDHDKFEKEFLSFFPSLMKYVSRSFGIELEGKQYKKIAGL
ncbi:MAG: DUF479 domain-containing protein [Bacteroidales bacterium]|nr:DUF479 domain-containing protein [Bacteroidales bacterium]